MRGCEQRGMRFLKVVLIKVGPRGRFDVFGGSLEMGEFVKENLDESRRLLGVIWGVKNVEPAELLDRGAVTHPQQEHTCVLLDVFMG